MVPEAGLEPARYFYRGILSPLCLPIPPLGQFLSNKIINIILLLSPLSLLFNIFKNLNILKYGLQILQRYF